MRVAQYVGSIVMVASVLFVSSYASATSKKSVKKESSWADCMQNEKVKPMCKRIMEKEVPFFNSSLQTCLSGSQRSFYQCVACTTRLVVITKGLHTPWSEENIGQMCRDSQLAFEPLENSHINTCLGLYGDEDALSLLAVNNCLGEEGLITAKLKCVDWLFALKASHDWADIWTKSNIRDICFTAGSSLFNLEETKVKSCLEKAPPVNDLSYLESCINTPGIKLACVSYLEEVRALRPEGWQKKISTRACYDKQYPIDVTKIDQQQKSDVTKCLNLANFTITADRLKDCVEHSARQLACFNHLQSLPLFGSFMPGSSTIWDKDKEFAQSCYETRLDIGTLNNKESFAQCMSQAVMPSLVTRSLKACKMYDNRNLNTVSH